ncbi:LacI family DNA-binding transcriptional regulator [Micromonospora vinacea]|uniref:LacI family DNA-binding transcriptional regulator n=1 Tax=Micromonospora vinacea TaxID=709878 RepID=UPI003454CACC
MEETLSTVERAVTISQVAALAGASTGTASTALNGRGALRPETRLRVQQAADQPGFVANAAARCLQTGRTQHGRHDHH